MKINVHLEDIVLPIECGEGRQRLKWLATVSCIRYGLLQNGFPHQYVPMRMERQPNEGEVLPNQRSRILRPHGVINVELGDDSHVTLWIRDTALDEKLHFSDSVLAGSVPTAEHGLHLSRLRADTAWTKGFQVSKGQSGQDALRHAVQVSAYSKMFDNRNKPQAHRSLYHMVHPSTTTLVTSQALTDFDQTINWSRRFQDAWDKVDVFDLIMKHDDGAVDGQIVTKGEDGRPIYTESQKKSLLEIAEHLHANFEAIATIFDHAAVHDPLSPVDKMSMLGFFSMMKKCHVPHQDVPMAHIDRIFIEVNWSSDPEPDHNNRNMDFSEFLEALIRVAEVRYSIDDEPVPLYERIEKLLHEKLIPNADAPFQDPFRNCLHSKVYINMLHSKRNLLLRVFKLFSVIDSDMHFHTMSVKEWGFFVSKLHFKGDEFTHRASRDVFWRSQGAFDSMEEREDFLKMLGASEDMNEGMDRGSNQEMTYPEFAEAVCRIAHQVYVHSLGEEKAAALDYELAAVVGDVCSEFDSLTNKMKTIFSPGP